MLIFVYDFFPYFDKFPNAFFFWYLSYRYSPPTEVTKKGEINYSERPWCILLTVRRYTSPLVSNLTVVPYPSNWLDLPSWSNTDCLPFRRFSWRTAKLPRHPNCPFSGHHVCYHGRILILNHSFVPFTNISSLSLSKAINFPETITHAIDFGPGGLNGIDVFNAKNCENSRAQRTSCRYECRSENDVELFSSTDVNYQEWWDKQ